MYNKILQNNIKSTIFYKNFLKKVDFILKSDIL